jgi:hypothetical protein
MPKFWLNNISFFLFCAAAPAAAQKTFYTVVPRLITYSDILELEKGGFIATGYKVYRLNSLGKYLSDEKLRTFNTVTKLNNKTGEYVFIGANSDAGEYYFAKTNAEWNTITENFENLNKIEDSCHTAYNSFYDTAQKKILVAGLYYPNCSKSSEFWPWAAILDENLRILKQNQIKTTAGRTGLITQILPNHKTGGYVALFKTEYGARLYEMIWLDSNLNTINASSIETQRCFNTSTAFFSKMVLRDDSLYTIEGSVRFTGDTCGSSRYEDYMYTFYPSGKLVSRISASYRELFQSNNGKGLLYLKHDTIGLMDSDLNVIWERQLFKPGNYGYDYFIIKPSMYGGYYGLFRVTNSLTNEYYVHLFRIDSLGNYTNEPEYSEWQQPLMLMPNPAKDKVRIMIPYYLGMVETRIYDLQGRLLLHKTHDEQEYLDISNFAPGSYVVKATDLKRGKTRMMKMVVE